MWLAPPWVECSCAVANMNNCTGWLRKATQVGGADVGGGLAHDKEEDRSQGAPSQHMDVFTNSEAHQTPSFRVFNGGFIM